MLLGPGRNEIAKDLQILQECLREMQTTSPADNAILAGKLAELAENPHLCDLIPGLRALKQTKDTSGHADNRRYDSKVEKGWHPTTTFKSLGRAHWPRKRGNSQNRGHGLSPASTAESEAPSNSTGSVVSPIKATPPTHPTQQLQDPTNHGKGENVRRIDDDEDDRDDRGDDDDDDDD